jgi:predicted Zn-dependent protease
VSQFQQSTSFAVLAGVAVGVVITLGSGELRAALDLSAAAKPTPSNPGSSPSAPAPKTAAQAAVEEKAAFRAKVLEAMKPELAAIEARAKTIDAKAATAKASFDAHTHEVEFASHGWVKIDTWLDADHFDTVRAPYLGHWLAIRDPAKAGTYMKDTSKPK